MGTLFKIFIGWVIFIVILVAAYFGYKRYIQVKSTECSQIVYANDPLLFQQYYCFEDVVADVNAKLDDTNQKIATLQAKSGLTGDMATQASNALICLQNYKIYLEMMADKYKNVSRPRLEELISAQCGAYYPVDKSVSGTEINCKSMRMPWITADDLKPDIDCPVFS